MLTEPWVGLVTLWGAIAAGGWMLYQLIRLSGRILIRLEAIETRVNTGIARPAPPELPLGSAAPTIELPDLDGAKHTLAEYAGRPILLVFFNPHCGFCKQMAGPLAERANHLKALDPLPLLVSTGAAEDNREFMLEHGLTCPIWLQTGMEVASRFNVAGTPIGYLIDAEGRIASPRTVGPDALLALLPAPAEPPAEANTERPPPIANGHAANGHAAPCPKCGKKGPCGRCGAAKPVDGTPSGDRGDAQPQDYDLLFADDAWTVPAWLTELSARTAGCTRLTIVAGPGAKPLPGEVPAIALRRFLADNPTWLVACHPEGDGRFLVLSRDPRDRKALPSALTQAVGFARALATHIGDGGRRVTPDQLRGRLEVCTLCDRRTGDRCSACGCDITTKAGWRTSQCPLKKWPTPTGGGPAEPSPEATDKPASVA
jgi:peroxiredoxin